jgi:Rrf2 family protein
MRLELQARTELTLKTLQALSDRRRCGGAALGRRVGSSAAYTAHIVAPLTRAGWVTSTPGPTGGYELVVDLDAVSLHQLIELVEGPTDDGHCVLVDRPCGQPDRCALHDAWSRARSALTTELESIPISQIIEHEEARS